MKTSHIPNKTTALALNQKAIEGVDKYLASLKKLTVAGASYTPATLTAVLQDEIDGDKAVDLARAQYRQQVVAARLARSKGRALRKGLKAYVLNNFGQDAVQVLETFGMTVPKALGTRSAKSKAQAADKSEATRKAHKEAIASIDAPPPSAPIAPASPAASVTPPKS